MLKLKDVGNEFDIDNVLALGVYDELHDLYVKMCELAYPECVCIEEAACRYPVRLHGGREQREGYGVDLTVLSEHEEKVIPRYCEILNDEFFSRYSWIFTKENAVMAQPIYFQRHFGMYTKTFWSGSSVFHDGFVGEARLISFKKFLELITDIVYLELGCYYEWGYEPDIVKKRVDINFNIMKSVYEVENGRFVPAGAGGAQPDVSIPVIVYRNTDLMSCIKNKHKVSSATMSFYTIDRKRKVSMPVRYCHQCKHYFVSLQTVEAFERRYARMFMKRLPDLAGGYDSWFDGAVFRESDLHKWGYRVGDTGLSEKERKDLLLSLIKTNTMSINRIARDIENAIRLFRDKREMRYAVQDWYNDLVYVRELQANIPMSTGSLNLK